MVNLGRWAAWGAFWAAVAYDVPNCSKSLACSLIRSIAF